MVANNSWPLVQRDLDWFVDHGNGKKMYLDEVDSKRHNVRSTRLIMDYTEWLAIRNLRGSAKQQHLRCG